MASGDLLFVFDAHGSFGPTSNYAQLDTRNTHPVLDFDAATDESRTWEGVIPPNYAGGGMTVKVAWRATSATSGDCYWQAKWEKTTGLDIDADSYDSAQSGNGAANGTSGIDTVTTITFTNSQIDGLAAGDEFRFSLNRDADNVSDSMAGDAEVGHISIYET